MTQVKIILFSAFVFVLSVQALPPLLDFLAPVDPEFLKNRAKHEFEKFKCKFNLSFAGEEEAHRLLIFARNLNIIDRHNSLKSRTFDMDVTMFAHQTPEEFMQRLGTLIPPDDNVDDSKLYEELQRKGKEMDTGSGRSQRDGSIDYTMDPCVGEVENQRKSCEMSLIQRQDFLTQFMFS